MKNTLIPENYEVIEELGLKGLVRIAKDDSQKLVLDCVHKLCLPAKSYGKIVIATLMNGEDSIKLTNYNGSEECKLPIFDIKFGANAIYIKTLKDGGNEVSWCLLDKKLKPVHYVGNFEIVDRRCADSYYIPVRQEFIEVRDEDGNYYNMQLSTGYLEEVRRSKRVEVVEVAPTAYRVDVDTVKNIITAVSNLGKSVNITAIHDVVKFKELFEVLLEKKAKVTSEKATVRGKVEDQIVGYSFSDIRVDLVDKFAELVKNFEYMADAEILIMLYKYVKVTNKDKDINTMELLSKELTSGFTTVVNESDGSYSMKCYFFSNKLFIMVRSKNGRIVTTTYDIGGKAFEEDELRLLEKAYELAGFNAAPVEIVDFDVSKIDTNASHTGKLPRPFSVLKRKEINNVIKSSYYGRIIQIDITELVVGQVRGEMSFTVAVCDDFTYIPKLKSNASTIVTSGKTNNILVMVG